MSQFLKRWKDPTFMLDFAQVVVASIVAIILALDMTGVWSGATWLSSNLASLTFIAVCVLIVSSFLERQILLERFVDATNGKLERIIESNPAGIKLENREAFKVPLETRMANAQDVFLLGSTLVGIVGLHEEEFFKRAKRGCRFRILVTDPTFFQQNKVPGSSRRQMYVEQTARVLDPLLNATENIQLKYMPFRPPFSLLMIDPNLPHGEVQVELYAYRAPSTERPHFVLTQSIHKQWYDFFKKQFEIAWQEAKPHVIQSETAKQ